MLPLPKPGIVAVSSLLVDPFTNASEIFYTDIIYLFYIHTIVNGIGRYDDDEKQET